jgi:hypothetical protein
MLLIKGDPSGTFAECQEGTLVGGKSVVTPDVITSKCPKGTFVDSKCVVTPNVVKALGRINAASG